MYRRYSLRGDGRDTPASQVSHVKPMADTLILSVMEQSAVKELANIGLGHATTALAELTGEFFSMSPPSVEHYLLTDVLDGLGLSESLTVGVSMAIFGEASGYILFLTSWQSAQKIWELLLSQAPSAPTEITELEVSAMLEVGNIINSSFLTAISDMINVVMGSSVPQMGIDMGASLLESVVVEASSQETHALTIRTEIQNRDHSVTGVFLYVPSNSGMRTAFGRLGLLEAA